MNSGFYRKSKMSRIIIIFIAFALFTGLASSTIIREGRISGDARMNEPKIQNCLRAKVCPITMDLTPLCASDGKTYSNHRVIDCLNECLTPEEKLTVASGGFCKGDLDGSR